MTRLQKPLLAVLVQTQLWPTPVLRSFRPRTTSTQRALLTQQQLALYQPETLEILPESAGTQMLLLLPEPRTVVSRRATK